LPALSRPAHLASAFLVAVSLGCGERSRNSPHLPEGGVGEPEVPPSGSSAPSPSPPSPADATDALDSAADVTGTVVSFSSLRPLAGRTVFIGGQTTSTDAEGRFTVAHVAAVYDLMVIEPDRTGISLYKGVRPPYWLTVSGGLSESGTTTNAAQLVVITVPYDDPLVLTDFKAALPENASITGIQFEVRRASLTGNAEDDSIQIVSNGTIAGTNHAHSGSWPTALAYSRYGGAYDTWGVPWTVPDLRSSGFGISIAPKYTGPPDGNEHVYVDSTRLTVFYTQPCE
jgi:hypothetical protein